VDLPDGQLVLIDGGGFVGSPVDPGLGVLLPTLRARRRSRVDVVILSHPHPDHFLGLVSALPKLEVGELWDTGQGEEEGAGPSYLELVSKLRARGVPVRRPDELCGKPRRHGDSLIEVIAPCPGFRPLVNPNDNSLVVRVSRGARTALFVGDAEHDEEASLIARYGLNLRADVLKIGHHGSRTSTTDGFLDAVRPTRVVISTGLRNRFGHPHPNTLATLHRHGLLPERTDELGGVTWIFE
jgi:competence protein ComEC